MRKSQAELMSYWRGTVVRATVAVMLVVGGGAASAAGAVPCPSEGPQTHAVYDYRVAPPNVIRVVEAYHFGPGVESLTKGNSTVLFGGDLAYTLRYFPNHHRALATLVRLAKREKTNRPRGTSATVECYFEAGLQIAPDDGVVELLYGMWLADLADTKGAAARLERARENAPQGNANFQYNLGLGWITLGRYDDALTAAHIAYGLGYPLPGLRQKLEKAGKWRPLPPKSAESQIVGGEEEKKAAEKTEKSGDPKAGQPREE